MFKKPTVFVVGAGGSCEFGMPSGAQLKNIISEKTTYTVDNGKRNRGDWELVDALSKPSSGLDKNTILHTTRELAQAMPLALASANYLPTHSGDKFRVAI